MTVTTVQSSAPKIGRLVVVGYTQRGEVRHIFSMRKANEREIAKIASSLG